MVAEVGGYRSSSAMSSRVSHLGSMNRSVGNYGSSYASYAAADISATGGRSSAPMFGRIRITQSVERESRNGDSSSGSFYAGSRGFTPTAPAASYGRRYSLSTDKIWPKDSRTTDLPASSPRSSLQPSSFYGSRRASLASAMLKYHAPSQHHYTAATDESGNYANSTYIDRSNSNSFPDYRYGSSSSISGISSKRNARESSVSTYDDHNLSARESSVTRYETLRRRSPIEALKGRRSPSVHDYDNQNSFVKASSVARYESYSSLGRSPSVSRYESQASSGRAPSLPRYEAQNYPQRSPSVSRYEGPTSSFARASSVSRFDAGQPSLGKRFRSASVSRYEVPSSLGTNDVEYPVARARSVARSENQYESTLSTPVDSSAVDDDSAYELRRQLRALRNQQIRAGSVTSHEKQEHVPHQHPEHHHVIRPRSLSTSSSTQRRHKVITLHTPIQVASPSNPPIITGYPEPTLYSAKVFRTLPGSHEDKSVDIAASSAEVGFIDNREDITSFVLKPGERFLPTDVSVNLLPSGRKAVTYTQFSQKGHGDQHSANAEIERIITKTKCLQESMHTLEDFVKRNRSLFPEDIIIYQKIIFYLLSESELIKMGEKPGTEIYGVKIRERLVAPHGTDVASILRRFYSRHQEVDVEYDHTESIRQQLKMTEGGGGGEVRIPNKGKRFDDDFDLDRERNVPHDWVPPRHSRSTDYDALYVDEDERRDGTRRTPKGQRPSVPEFSHRLRRQRAAVGQAVRFSCSVSAFPEPEIKWYRGKQEITDNGRFTAKNVSGLCTLTISDVTADDAVAYSVKAFNSEGEATTSALLEVYDLRASASERLPASRKQTSSEPIAAPGAAAAGAGGRRPFFLLEARNLWADVGERAVFEVQAAGKPLPSFTWIRDEDQLSEDDHIQILSDGYGNCKLVIKEIRETDFGTYRCLAQNEDGTVESIAALFCVGNESVRPGQALKNELRSSAGQHKGRKPQFVHSPPSRIDVMEGEALTLQCVVDGDPKPLVTWYKGVRELTYTGRHRVLEERNNCYVMQIKSTLATDSGEYTVTAHNLCGLIECIVCVNVLPGKPSMEDFDTNWKRLDLTPLQYELVTKTRQGKMPPIFVKKLPREKQMKVGESLKLDCYVEESKPREYLVDVDVVVKDSKKEDPLPITRAEKPISIANGSRISPKPKIEQESRDEPVSASIADPSEQPEAVEQEILGNATAESLLGQEGKEEVKGQEEHQKLSPLGSEVNTAISTETVGPVDVDEQNSPVNNNDAVITVRSEPSTPDQVESEAVTVHPVEPETIRSSDAAGEELDSSVAKDIDCETLQSHFVTAEPTIVVKATEDAQDAKSIDAGEGEDGDESSSESNLSSDESEEEP